MNGTDWQLVVNARNRKRLQSENIINLLFEDFIELHGDRVCHDDMTIMCGLAKFKNKSITVIAFRKGCSISDIKKYRNGMADASGYRKALRLAKQAEKFNRPIVCLIDTPGAYPGIISEERMQAEAIAQCLLNLSDLEIPIISFIISEACSGGALAFCVSDKLYMFENAYFSILSPEGYASILWKNNDFERAAHDLKLDAHSLLESNIIDGIVPEDNLDNTINYMKEKIEVNIKSFNKAKRINKIRYIDIN